MLARIAILIGVLLSTLSTAEAMNFTWRDPGTVLASGPIQLGDAAKFEALAVFSTLDLDSTGGLVEEALQIARNMDARGGIRTVVNPGSSCASACAMVLFVSGETRIVYTGGRLGIHSCRQSDGTPDPICNRDMAANALAHGVPWGNIESFGNQTKPTDMMWFSAEDAECWGFMKWSADDESHFGLACVLEAELRHKKQKPDEVTDENANYILCRLNAGTSLINIASDDEGQGFSDIYRKSCERIAADPKIPKYAAIDIIMWLTLTDPDVLRIKPATLTHNILDSNVDNCWKCQIIFGMSELMNGYPREALNAFRLAKKLVERDTGSIPQWLNSRIDLAKQELEKKS